VLPAQGSSNHSLSTDHGIDIDIDIDADGGGGAAETIIGAATPL
jgi:hypothetical protein